MKLTIAVSGIAILAGGTALAQCDTVTMSDVGWTDITVTTATAKHVLEGLGYEVDVKVLSVPVTFASLENDDLDVFLGNWMPAQTQAIGPYLDSGEIEQISVNLEGTKYTLAVPAYTWNAGLRSFADISKFADDLDEKIYGIEPGNEGNAYLVSLTEEDTHGLGDFEVVESSEQGMLAQVARAYKRNEHVVFLGWEPHPMNANFDLKYLPGGEEFFGGEGVVHTVTREGYSKECPNLGKLFSNMGFTLAMENEIMGRILDEGADPAEATESWLKSNVDVLASWLQGVSTADGGNALAAVKSHLGI